MRRERVEIPAAGGEAPLAVDADVAETFAERARGLIGRPGSEQPAAPAEEPAAE